MKRRAEPLWTIGLAAASAGLLACVVEATVPPPQPPHPPQGPAAPMAPAVANGGPEEIRPGSGFYLWIKRRPDGVWQVRSTTPRKRHIFRGRIVGETSPINWYQSHMMEVGDSIINKPDGLVFKFETAGHIDGFDFVPQDHRCVRFHITVDERPAPKRIKIGPQQVDAPSDHFVLCP